MSKISDSRYTCISFKVDGDDSHILMTNRIDGNVLRSNVDIWVNKNKIEIVVGNERHMIKHNCVEWAVLFISFHLKSRGCEIKYSVDNVAGEFLVHAGPILGGDNSENYNLVGDNDGLYISCANNGGEVSKIEMIAYTYHKQSKTEPCICEQRINGENCPFCEDRRLFEAKAQYYKEEVEKLYESRWFKDYIASIANNKEN